MGAMRGGRGWGRGRATQKKCKKGAILKRLGKKPGMLIEGSEGAAETKKMTAKGPFEGE